MSEVAKIRLARLVAATVLGLLVVTIALVS